MTDDKPVTGETGTDIAKPKRGHNLKGRPKGAKNKTTLFKEVMQQGFEESLEKDFPNVVKTVIAAAKKGDMKAAKMLFDRVIPVSKAVDLNQLGKAGISISINVGEMDKDNPHGITIDGDCEVVEEDENE
jgi:hypothetical protein